MEIRTLDAYLPGLDQLSSRHDEATFYHSRAWLESLAAVFPRMSLRCLVAGEGGRETGFLPFFVLKRGPVRTVWSLPFGTYGGPVANDETVARALVDAFAEAVSARGVVEAGWVDFANSGLGQGWAEEKMETHMIDLSGGFDELWSGAMDRQRKKRMRRAERLGIAVRRSREPADVQEYYRIYSERVDEWGGFRYPRELFVELLDRAGDRARLYVAEHQGRIVGGHFNFYFKDTVTAWNGVTTPDSNHLQPGTLLYIHCLREACAEGYRRYNLGGSLKKRSLIEFKESLGGAPYTYSCFRRRSIVGSAAAWVRGRGG